MPTSRLQRRNVDSENDDIVFSSQVPEMIFQHMTEARKYHILDLGPPVQENVTLFSGQNIRHYIDDLQSSLDVFSETLIDVDASDISSHCFGAKEFAQFLPYSADTRFDVILLWDLPNYLNEQSIEALVSHLGQYCRRGALLYFLVYIHKEMPIRPSRMHFQNLEQVVYYPRLPIEECSPRYTPKHLEKMMSGFTIYRLYLLGNGLQEHVFRFEKPLDRPNLTIIGNR